MRHEGTLKVTQEVADEMERLCREPDDSVGKCEVVFDEEYTFANGMRLAVQVCGTTDPGEEECWTQGVLFTPDGGEVGCTDCGDSFLGEYHTQDIKGNEYVVEVVVEPSRAERIKEQALSGLLEYHECLHDGTFVEEIRSSLVVPDTGNDQTDYENVRDQVERAIARHEQ